MPLRNLVLATGMLAVATVAVAGQPIPAPPAAVAHAAGAISAAPRATVDDIHQGIDAARAEIPAIAAYYGWGGAVPVTESEALDANSREVSINETELQALIRPLPQFLARQAIRMLVAHEVWHYVELQQTRADPSQLTGEERALYECRADLMAGRYLTSLAPGTPPAPDSDASTAWFVAENLWTSDTPDHPTASQRQTAAQLGALSVFRERVSPADATLAGRIGEGMDVAGGQSLAAWREAACERVIHFRRAALATLIVTLDGPKSAPGGDVTFTVNYINTGYVPVSVSTDVVASYFHLNDGTADADKSLTWRFPRDFDVEPGRPYALDARIHNFTGDPSLIFLRYAPSNPDTLISAAIKPGARWAIETARVGAGLSPGDAELGLAVMRLSNDALSGFSHNRKPGAEVMGTGLAMGSMIDIPQSLGTRIYLNADGGARVSATLYSGPSLPAAKAIFDKETAALRRIWPTAPRHDVPSAGPIDESAVFSLTRFATLRLAISHYQSNYFESLEITPNVLGLIGP